MISSYMRIQRKLKEARDKNYLLQLQNKRFKTRIAALAKGRLNTYCKLGPDEGKRLFKDFERLQKI